MSGPGRSSTLPPASRGPRYTSDDHEGPARTGLVDMARRRRRKRRCRREPGDREGPLRPAGSLVDVVCLDPPRPGVPRARSEPVAGARAVPPHGEDVSTIAIEGEIGRGADVALDQEGGAAGPKRPG